MTDNSLSVPPPDPVPGPPPAERIPSDVPSDSRGWAVAAHLLPLASIYVFGALIVWLIKRDEDPFVEEHAREALNFQLSMMIYAAVSFILILVIVGIVMLAVLAIVFLVFMIIAAVKAANGEMYLYPMTMRMVKGK